MEKQNALLNFKELAMRFEKFQFIPDNEIISESYTN